MAQLRKAALCWAEAAKANSLPISMTTNLNPLSKVSRRLLSSVVPKYLPDKVYRTLTLPPNTQPHATPTSVNMWLINTATLKLEYFANHPIKQYAILSHRWEENEVSFQSWVARKDEKTQGVRKITRFVKLAAEHGFKYAWADTCCINKESSAELSEAINSMFKVCLNDSSSLSCRIYLIGF